jgi:hypothetical protein
VRLRGGKAYRRRTSPHAPDYTLRPKTPPSQHSVLNKLLRMTAPPSRNKAVPTRAMMPHFQYLQYFQHFRPRPAPTNGSDSFRAASVSYPSALSGNLLGVHYIRVVHCVVFAICATISIAWISLPHVQS